jgi:hypothetical protein
MIIDHRNPTLTELQFYEIVETIAEVGKDYDDYRTYCKMCDRYGKEVIDHIVFRINDIYLDILRGELFKHDERTAN